MTQRNLARWVDGDPGREMVRRTINELEARVSQLSQLLTQALARIDQGMGSGGLTPQQQSDVAGLIGALAQSVIGQSSPDPLLTPVSAGGTVTNFTAGDLSPLFTTSEATPTTTPALTFTQVNQNANLIFSGPASGGGAAPTFRMLVAADLPVAAVQSTASKTTAGAPYANDGYIDVTINGVAVRLMTTA